MSEIRAKRKSAVTAKKITFTNPPRFSEVNRVVSDYRVRDSVAAVVEIGCRLLNNLVPSNWEGHHALRSHEFERFLAICKRDLTDLLTTDHDLDVCDFADAYQAVNLLRKYPFDYGVDREAVAHQKWRDSEEQCRVTNLVFKAISVCGADGLEESILSPLSPRVYAILRRARRKIERWLGRFQVSEWVSSCRFGDGATTSCRGAALSVGDKLASTLEYQGNGNILGALVKCFPRWQESDPTRGPTFCPGNLMLTVPKDASTNRPIGIEPTLSGFAQLGIGSMLRERLRRVGCNLNDQGINQSLAYEACSRSLATIDLQSASDTIALELVRWLIPQDWFFALTSCRSSFTLFNGERVALEKFSSMGNGYTFELESLIFLALTRATADEMGTIIRMGENCHVYGDDIILPAAIVSEIKPVLHFCGFTLNARKSFSDGPFRESCGVDVYKGTIVTPLYIKEPLEDAFDVVELASRVYHAAVGDVRPSVRGWRNPYSGTDGLTFADRRWLPAYKAVVGLLPPLLRKQLVGPWTPGVNSPWIPSTFDAACPELVRGQDKRISKIRVVDSVEGHERSFRFLAVDRHLSCRYGIERWSNVQDIILYTIRDKTSGEGIEPHARHFKKNLLWKKVVDHAVTVRTAVDKTHLPRGRDTSVGARRMTGCWVEPPNWV